MLIQSCSLFLPRAETPTLIKRRGKGIEYGEKEDEWLLDTIIEKCQKGHTYKLGGVNFWKDLAAEQVCACVCVCVCMRVCVIMNSCGCVSTETVHRP